MAVTFKNVRDASIVFEQNDTPMNERTIDLTEADLRQIENDTGMDSNFYTFGMKIYGVTLLEK